MRNFKIGAHRQIVLGEIYWRAVLRLRVPIRPGKQLQVTDVDMSLDMKPLLPPALLLNLFLDLEDGGGMFLRKIGWRTTYTRKQNSLTTHLKFSFEVLSSESALSKIVTGDLK
jgi:hypothetical protein